ncbi:MAG: Maf family protein [Methylovulum sp.]|uniref:Maf family protein n=1 Tax=Methylovulum sp. TaxID=1916980 RepID=UPI00260BF4DF|nr:Maf family protein [Methylovulum sp.]MDD2722447.1 Maf family protein [Methylovulum sp.]MDD5124503.1 Maf family protein [Methylovulum sp.]
MTTQLILASASPRRRELLDQICINYHVCPVDIDETPLPDEAPLAYVQRMAAEKSAAGVAQYGAQLPVLAADTTVVLLGRIMGKPRDKDDALEMLRSLSGNRHQVFTSVSLRGRQHGEAVSITEVTFRCLTDAEIVAYWESGEPQDKAGAYAIQGRGGVFVESITGSFSGVVGLPVFETAQLLAQQGINCFISNRRNNFEI